MTESGTENLLNKQHQLAFELTPHNNKRLMMICGQYDNHLKWLEDTLDIHIKYRSHKFSLKGSYNNIHNAKLILESLFTDSSLVSITLNDFNLLAFSPENRLSKQHRHTVKPRSSKQKNLLDTVQSHPITLVSGPAGTGKTYLAVAAAAQALLNKQVDRIILSRPAVDAGEKLGFLPGDMAQKVDPYIKPLTDSLIDILGAEKYQRYSEKNIIEIAPIAFMRGRTLSHSFIVLDEAQNTTIEQMKMFLTRIGFGSRMVVTGDLSQIDLPHAQESGLFHACQILKDIQKIALIEFDHTDVVRHPLISEIIKAYNER